jgi:hypothetical protein
LFDIASAVYVDPNIKAINNIFFMLLNFNFPSLSIAMGWYSFCVTQNTHYRELGFSRFACGWAV